MKRILIFSIMLLLLNMNAHVTLGNVELKNVNKFEITESILEISNTATITIPHNYAKLNEKPILYQFRVGDLVVIQAGYNNGEPQTEFTGYIQKIESDAPIVIHCEDLYKFRQTNYVKSYQDASLRQVLEDIVPKDDALVKKIVCDDVQLGKFQIDNANALTVLKELMKDYGLYSSLHDGELRVGLAYGFGASTQEHIYYLNEIPDGNTFRGNVKKNELAFKRKEDFKVRYKAIANNPNGQKTTVIVGDKDGDASERTLNFAGPLTEAQLKERALAVMAKTVYDGYTGDITGFGYPYTHAGDALIISDREQPEREGKFLIEKVVITYDVGNGFSRKNTLSYKI